MPQLIRGLLAREDQQLEELTGVIAPAGVVLLGATNHLPWADRCEYLGRQPGTPHVYMNTLLQANVPAYLLDQSLYHRFQEPVAIPAQCLIVVPLAAARTLSRPKLRAFI